MAKRTPLGSGASYLVPALNPRSLQSHAYWGQYPYNATVNPSSDPGAGSLPNENANPLLAPEFDKLEIGDIAVTTDAAFANRGVFYCVDIGTVGAGDAVWRRLDPGSTSSMLVSAPGAYSCPAGVALRDVVYVTGSLAVDQADAAAPATADAVGIVVAKPTAVTCTVAYAGEVTGFAGLTPGSRYFLSETTPGAITLTPPSAAGQTVLRVGIAASASVLLLGFGDPVLL